MIPTRGRNGGVKQWKNKLYCSHGVCKSNTMESEENVIMMPFPKPCALHYATLIDPSATHNPSTCEQCTKCLRWIYLCQRSDNKLKCLIDIARHTYICSKHFKDPRGPTDEDPDPFPADILQNEVVKEQKTRVRCESLQPLPLLQPSERLKTSTINVIETAVPEVVQNQFEQSYLQPEREVEEIFLSDPCIEDDALTIFHNNFMAKGEIVLPPHIHVASHQPSERVEKSTTNDIEPHVTEVVQDQFEPSYFQPKHEEISRSNHPSFEDVATSIFHHNFMVSYNQECIQVAISDDVKCIIDRHFTFSVKVFDTDVPKSNDFWSNKPHSFDPLTFDYIVFLKSLKYNWHVCKSFLNTNLALKYQATLDSETASTVKINPLINCSVLSQKNMCTACKVFHRKLRRKLKRKKESTSNKKNIKLLSKDEAVQSVREARRALYLEKRKSARLRRRLINKMYEENGVKVSDHGDSEDAS